MRTEGVDVGEEAAEADGKMKRIKFTLLQCVCLLLAIAWLCLIAGFLLRNVPLIVLSVVCAAWGFVKSRGSKK